MSTIIEGDSNVQLNRFISVYWETLSLNCGKVFLFNALFSEYP